MAELIEIGEQQERVILFAASTNDSDDTEESVEELKELVKTAGAETVGTVIQNRENIHPGTYLGKGKIQELKEMVWESPELSVTMSSPRHSSKTWRMPWTQRSWTGR